MENEGERKKEKKGERRRKKKNRLKKKKREVTNEKKKKIKIRDGAKGQKQRFSIVKNNLK